MKNFFIIPTLASLILAGCATTGTKESTGEFEEGQIISLPKAPSEGISRSPFFNTQKSRIGEKNGFVYDFYYGAGGRYLVVITPPKSYVPNFKQAEGTLLVDGKGIDPEIISLAVDDKGVFSGIGTTRNGRTEFNLTVNIPASRYNGPVVADFNFFINITDETFAQ